MQTRTMPIPTRIIYVGPDKSMPGPHLTWPVCKFRVPIIPGRDLLIKTLMDVYRKNLENISMSSDLLMLTDRFKTPVSKNAIASDCIYLARTTLFSFRTLC